MSYGLKASSCDHVSRLFYELHIVHTFAGRYLTESQFRFILAVQIITSRTILDTNNAAVVLD